MSLRTHPVRYLGKAADDQPVLNELRVQVAPRLKALGYTMTATTALALSGLVLAMFKPSSPSRWMLSAGIGVAAGTAALQVRNRINAMSDEQLLKVRVSIEIATGALVTVPAMPL